MFFQTALLERGTLDAIATQGRLEQLRVVTDGGGVDAHMKARGLIKPAEPPGSPSAVLPTLIHSMHNMKECLQRYDEAIPSEQGADSCLFSSLSSAQH